MEGESIGSVIESPSSLRSNGRQKGGRDDGEETARQQHRILVVRCGEKRSIEFCAILKSSSQESIDFSLDFCKNLLADK